MAFKISICFFTYRSGAGFDILRNALSNQTHTDWELCICDDYAPRNAHPEKVKEYFDKEKLTWYGPSKAKFYKDTPYNQVNAVNTAMLHATGELVVILEDFVWFPEDYLEKWIRAYSKAEVRDRAVVTGAAIKWSKKDFTPIIDDFQITEKELGPMDQWPSQGWLPTGIWSPSQLEFFSTAFPLKLLKTMNLFDERLDYWREWPAKQVPRQITENGGRMFVTDLNMVHILDHHDWLPHTDWHLNYRRTGEQDDKLRPKEEPVWTKRSLNDFSF